MINNSELSYDMLEGERRWSALTPESAMWQQFGDRLFKEAIEWPATIANLDSGRSDISMLSASAVAFCNSAFSTHLGGRREAGLTQPSVITALKSGIYWHVDDMYQWLDPTAVGCVGATEQFSAVGVILGSDKMQFRPHSEEISEPIRRLLFS